MSVEMVDRSVIWLNAVTNGEIVSRVKRLAGTVSGAALLACVVFLGDSALAQEAESAQVRLTQSRDSGVSGTATLTDIEEGVKVKLNMRGLPEAGVKHINHIHSGRTCADDRAGRTAPVTIPLSTVVADADGTGAATTIVKDVTLDKLFGGDQERYILLHAKAKKGEGIPPGITCADLVRTTGSVIKDPDLPGSGGIRPDILLGIAAIVVLAPIAGLFALGITSRPR